MTVQIILKNSSVVDKRPAATQLANGELSLNYNEAGAFLCCVDSAGNVQQVGGVKISADAPGSPVRGTMWLQPATSTLFIYNGTAWLSIAGGGGGGGGGGDITQVLGGDGINTSELSGVVTVNADIDTDRGLNFVGGQIAINPGANISFDAQGRLRAEASALAYRGTVDLVAGAVPADPTQGDTHANVVSGDMSAAWQTATGEGAIQVAAGDLVVWNGTIWTYIPTGGVPGQGTDLTVDNRTTTALDIASSTGDDATIPAATDALAGLMTAADKSKLDDVEDDAQANVQADWNETDTDSDAFIQNKPTIPAAQVQSNWTETDNTDPSFIQNKPTIPAAQVQSDWTETDNTDPSFIQNKPTIPAAQVQSDWDETDTLEPSFIQNKPDLTPTGDGDFGYWNKDGTTLSPATAGDNIVTTGRIGAGTSSPASDANLTLTASSPTIFFERPGGGQDGAIQFASGVFNFLNGANSTTVGGLQNRMQIEAGGDLHLGDGTTHAVSLSPAQSGSPLVRDSNGRLLVGTDAVTAEATLVLQGSSNTTDGDSVLFICRGTVPTTSVAGAEIGKIKFGDVSQSEAAEIRVERDGGTWDPGSSHPARIIFYTTANGASAPTERMRISADGSTSMTGRVSITQRTITSGSTWNSATANYWTFAGGTIANPTNQVAGTCGLIVCTGAVTGWGTDFNSVDVSTVPAVVPYYIQASGTIRVGQPVEVG